MNIEFDILCDINPQVRVGLDIDGKCVMSWLGRSSEFELYFFSLHQRSYMMRRGDQKTILFV